MKQKKSFKISLILKLLTLIPVGLMMVFGLIITKSSSDRCCTFVAKEETKSVADALAMKYYEISEINEISNNNKLLIAIYDGGSLAVDDGISNNTLGNVAFNDGIFQTVENINGQNYFVCYREAVQNCIVKVSYPEAKAKSTSSLAFSTNAVLLVILCLLFIAPIIPFSSKISKAMDITLNQIDMLSEGQLNVEVNEKIKARKDELGYVQNSIEKLSRNLKGIIGNIEESSESLEHISSEFADSFNAIVESIENVNVAVEEIAKGASAQSDESSTLNSKFASIGNSIEAAGKSVEALATSASTMKEYNKTAQQTIYDIEIMSEKTNRSVEEIKEQTSKTNKSVMEIQSATDMIAAIAAQTNLLSLNASIEAARAGEMGRGFAVVADEIRTLADQSKQSAQIIENTVNELIENSSISVQAMEQASEIMRKQSEGIATSKDVFTKLNAEIDNVVMAVDSITEKIQILDKDKNTAMDGMESLAAIAEENAASTLETSASMSNLAEVVALGKANTDEIKHLSSTLKEQTQKVSF